MKNTVKGTIKKSVHNLIFWISFQMPKEVLYMYTWACIFNTFAYTCIWHQKFGKLTFPKKGESDGKQRKRKLTSSTCNLPLASLLKCNVLRVAQRPNRYVYMAILINSILAGTQKKDQNSQSHLYQLTRNLPHSSTHWKHQDLSTNEHSPTN